MKENTMNKALSAAEYLIRFADPVKVLGRDDELKCVIDRIKMPALPLLASNKAQREQMNETAVKRLLKGIKDAVAEQNNKPFFVPLYELETPFEGEEPAVDEPLTIEQFEKLCHE